MKRFFKRIGAFFKEMWMDTFGGYLPHMKCETCGKQEMYVGGNDTMFCSNVDCENAGNPVSMPMPPEEKPYEPMWFGGAMKNLTEATTRTEEGYGNQHR